MSNKYYAQLEIVITSNNILKTTIIELYELYPKLKIPILLDYPKYKLNEDGSVGGMSSLTILEFKLWKQISEDTGIYRLVDVIKNE